MESVARTSMDRLEQWAARGRERRELDVAQERRDAAVERAFLWLEEEVRACFHRAHDCHCDDAMDILDAAGRLEDCGSCFGTGTLYTHSSYPCGGREDCGSKDGCDASSCRGETCPDCRKGKRIAGGAA